MLNFPAKRRPGGGPLDPGADTVDNPSVANLAALAALNVIPAGANSALPEGWEVYVETMRCKWRLRATAVAPVAFEIVTSTANPTRQWWREDCEASDANPWLNQLAWAVNPATGNNEAVGTAVAPLASYAEFGRRMRGAVLNASYSVSFLGAVAAIDVSGFELGPLGMLVLDGNAGATVAAAWPAGVTLAAIAGYTAPNPAGPEAAIVDVAVPALFDWTPYVGLRVRCSPNAFPHAAGPLDRCTFEVLQVNPAGGGNNTARINVPNGFDPYDTLLPGLTGLVPQNGDFLFCEDLPRSGPISIDITKQNGATLPSVNVTGFDVRAAAGVPIRIRCLVPEALANPDFGKPIFFGCLVRTTQVSGSANFWVCLFDNPGGAMLAQGDNIEQNRLVFTCCGWLNVNMTLTNCVVNTGLMEAGGFVLRGFNRFVGANGFFDNVGFTALNVDQPGTFLQSSGATYGDTNARGLYVTTPGFLWTYDFAPAVNAGGLSEFRVLGVEYTWGLNLPYPAAATVEVVAIRPPVV
jgi:hypothetical protein